MRDPLLKIGLQMGLGANHQLIWLGKKAGIINTLGKLIQR